MLYFLKWCKGFSISNSYSVKSLCSNLSSVHSEKIEVHFENEFQSEEVIDDFISDYINEKRNTRKNISDNIKNLTEDFLNDIMRNCNKNNSHIDYSKTNTFTLSENNDITLRLKKDLNGPTTIISPNNDSNENDDEEDDKWSFIFFLFINFFSISW